MGKLYINGMEVTGTCFAYDGCHKIYTIETNEDMQEAIENYYKILPISALEDVYNHSCELRFINNWALDKFYAFQFENAIFVIK